MKFCLLFATLSCLIFVSNGLSFQNAAEWKKFKTEHGKVYNSPSENQARMRTWLKNKSLIDEHNKKFAKGKVSYKMAVNKFTDMNTFELNKLYTGLKLEKLDEAFVKQVVYNPTGPIADTKDWRSEGAVTDVKDQGQCGSCYAFSVTGVLEGQHFLKTGKLLSISEQQIVDCSRSYSNSGCGGGYTHKSYAYIKDAGGIDGEDTYPYAGIDTEDCVFNKDEEVATVESYEQINKNEEDLLNAVASIGPISVGIMAKDSLYSYSEGVYNDPACTEAGINHAVLIVGYGNENGQDYWLVKNSWGTSWGDAGYVKMSRNLDNQCGIASYATVPTQVSQKKKEVTKTSEAGFSTNFFMKLVMTKSS